MIKYRRNFPMNLKAPLPILFHFLIPPGISLFIPPTKWRQNKLQIYVKIPETPSTPVIGETLQGLQDLQVCKIFIIYNWVYNVNVFARSRT